MPYTNIIIVLLALAASAAFPPFNLHALILVIIAPLLVWIRRSASVKQALGYGLLFGVVYIATLHFWMMSLQTFVPLWTITLTWLAYSVYLGLFFGGTFAVIRWLPDKVPLWLSAPAAWTLFEYIRTLGPIGNPAGDVGYAVLNLQPLPLVGALGGIFLVSYLVITINALVADIVLKNWTGKLITCFLTFIIAGFWLSTGQLIRYHTLRNAPDDPIQMVLIQGNHPQMDKFNPILWAKIKQDYLTLTTNAPSADVVVWPETITPTLNDEDATFGERIRHLAIQRKSAIVWGTPFRKKSLFYNAIVGVNCDGNTLEPYLKNQLMPFGEYWPGRSVLTQIGLKKILGTDYSHGQETRPLAASDSIKIGSVICLESMYPSPLRKATQEGATVLVVVANNAWFTHSSAAENHLEMSQMRAIENGRWLGLAANTGRTAFIDPLGNITQTLPPDEQGTLVGRVTLNRTKTAYTTHGNWIITLSVVILCVGTTIKLYQRYKSTRVN